MLFSGINLSIFNLKKLFFMSHQLKIKSFDFFQLYDRFINDSVKGKRLQPNGKKVSAGTIVSYKCTRGLLVKFVKNSSFELRINQVKKFTTRQLHAEKNYWSKFYKHFTNYLHNDCGHFDNYVGLNMKNIRTFFGYLNKNLLIDTGGFHKQLYVRKEEISIVTLLPEDLNFFIYDSVFAENLSNKLKRAKDIFVFGCSVALRFSDLMCLRKANIRCINQEYYLIARSLKTQTETQIKLPDYAVAIIKKYSLQKGGWLLPRCTNGALNKYVKQLTEKAGLIQPVKKIRDIRGVEKEISMMEGLKRKSYRFCDLVTTHTMRRTAITTMLSLGMPEHIVRKISGHAPGSKEFYRYVSLAQGYQDRETEIMFAKLKERA